MYIYSIKLILYYLQVRTPARTGGQASTVKPCQTRKVNDLHAQVGPGQKLAIKWATGHGFWSYNTLVVLSGQDEWRMASSGFKDILQEYIDDAPEGSNQAEVEGLQRLHGGDQYDADYYEDDPIFGEQVFEGDDLYIEHEHYLTDKLFKFQSAELTEDIRLDYYNEKHPWLEALFRYNNRKHLAHDYDAIELAIEGRLPPYIYIYINLVMCHPFALFSV